MLFHASTDFPFFPGVICARQRVLPFVLCLPSSALPHQKLKIKNPKLKISRACGIPRTRGKIARPGRPS
jgi:hypothetical protein